jgi:hypothetical protein
MTDRRTFLSGIAGASVAGAIGLIVPASPAGAAISRSDPPISARIGGTSETSSK